MLFFLGKPFFMTFRVENLISHILLAFNSFSIFGCSSLSFLLAKFGLLGIFLISSRSITSLPDLFHKYGTFIGYKKYWYPFKCLFFVLVFHILFRLFLGTINCTYSMLVWNAY